MGARQGAEEQRACVRILQRQHLGDIGGGALSRAMATATCTGYSVARELIAASGPATGVVSALAVVLDESETIAYPTRFGPTGRQRVG